MDTPRDLADPTSRPEGHPWARFGLFQVIVWALLSTVVALPAALFPGVSWPNAAVWVLAWAGTGLLCSNAIAAVVVRLPERWLRGLRALVLLLTSCTAGSAVWTVGMFALEPLIGREPWAPPRAVGANYYVMTLVRGAFFFGLWNAIFLVNLLSQRVQRAREHTLRAQALAERMQLQVLRSQINPHFLFNALNSVVALISESPRAAQTMVRDVATLLRKALDADTRGETTVAQELDFVHLYLKCEQVRFESRLQVEFDVAEGLSGLSVPPMLLHPLVENAVKHGMRGAAEAPLQVRISARREGADLVFEVANTGRLEPPRDALGADAPPGIGLQNVQGRLAHLFPSRSAFSLTEDAGWVVARLRVPTGGA